METFGERLRHLRKKKGMSGEALASHFGLGKNATSAWETGKSKPTSDDLVKLSELLNTTPNYLLLGTSDDNQYVIEILKKLNVANEMIIQYERERNSQLKERAETVS